MVREARRIRAARQQSIGNYEVLRKLAIGGMGEVFLARQKGPVDFSRQVVLKKLHARFTRDPQFVTMFLNEARIVASLTHPNIIHVYEFFEDGDGYVIAMEYVRGGTVLSLLRARATLGSPGLPYGPMVRIVTSVCEALHYAYSEPDVDGAVRHIVHRDISPSNVLVGYDGQVKLADFGVAKALAEAPATKSTTIKGKYGYLTPEQIRCEQLDQRSDIFSLGTVLWEMSVGKRLFERESEMQMLYAILEEPIPTPSSQVSGYPPELERVVMKALARSRDERYPDAEAFAADLRAIAYDHRWDCEKPALAQLVKALLPENQIAYGQIGSDAFGLPRPLSSDNEPGGRLNSFASMEVIDSEIDGPLPPQREGWLSRGNLVTIMILLAASAAFWLWIVPWIDP